MPKPEAVAKTAASTSDRQATSTPFTPEPIAVERDGEGLITISSLPRADVYVDGKRVRKTPLFKHEVNAGAREVRLVTADGRSHSFKLDVRDGSDIHKVWSFDDGRFVGR